jgi:type VI secretion system (T6SS) baseplate-like injector VgrG
MNQYFGKYRGKVVNNIDPLQQGRIQVGVPAVLGEGRLSWAMPCAPYGGAGVGLFAIPPVDANVWVEFEGGDPDYPIWAGCFWGVGEVPALPALAEMKVFKTDSITLTLNDLPGVGGFTIEVNPPAVATPLKLVFNAAGIELTNSAASVKLTPASVSINNGALEVI